MAFAAKTLLVLVTLVCLASMGGAMMFAAPVLVPLHVLAARRAGPYTSGGWVFLMGASVLEFSTMWTWAATDDTVTSLAIGAGTTIASMLVLLRDLADRAEVASGRVTV